MSHVRKFISYFPGLHCHLPYQLISISFVCLCQWNHYLVFTIHQQLLLLWFDKRLWGWTMNTMNTTDIGIWTFGIHQSNVYFVGCSIHIFITPQTHYFHLKIVQQIYWFVIAQLRLKWNLSTRKLNETGKILGPFWLKHSMLFPLFSRQNQFRMTSN